jgi:hypothetical protein
MVMDSAALGAVFLVSLVLAVASGDPAALRLLDTGQSTLGAAVLGFGVGASLALLGAAVWSLLFPYEAEPKGLLRVGRHGRRAGWSKAPHAEVYEAAAGLADTETRAAFLATSYILYRYAPDSVVQWMRRRHAAFATSLNASVAIVLGAAGSLVVTPVLTPARVGVLVLLGLVVVITLRSGFSQRHQAVQMERLWFATEAAKAAKVGPTSPAAAGPAASGRADAEEPAGD